MNIPINGQSPIDICIDILGGMYRDDYQDDRRLQMAACYFLAQNAPAGDPRVIDALKTKLSDSRAINEYITDNEYGTVGSDFYVDACAADALAILDDMTTVSNVRTNKYWDGGWCPSQLKVEDGKLLNGQSFDGAALDSLMRYHCLTCGGAAKITHSSIEETGGSRRTGQCPLCGPVAFTTCRTDGMPYEAAEKPS
jgi:hypothetical protein